MKTPTRTTPGSRLVKLLVESAMGIVSFPAGPGKIKVGLGMVGSSAGFSMENPTVLHRRNGRASCRNSFDRTPMARPLNQLS